MVDVKSPSEFAAMREAGRVVANALAATRRHAAVGVTLLELDEVAAAVISEAGAASSFLGYKPAFGPTPYPGVICASVNDMVVHGIPGSYRLADGDLLSVDCGASVDGWHGDAAISFIVGEARPADLKLLADTKRALDAGIAAMRVGHRVNDISAAIGAIGREEGYGILPEFGGHGIGRAMHEQPFVANDRGRGRGLRLRVGHALAIEPMFLAGGRDDHLMASDGWGVHSSDGSRAAHFEHTVALTAEGPRILTLP
jgi:methionyl aminopeptidase